MNVEKITHQEIEPDQIITIESLSTQLKQNVKNKITFDVFTIENVKLTDYGTKHNKKTLS
jgi:hypothetical protein